MSTVCVLTPIVIGSWPMISTAILGAAGAMGFTVAAGASTAGGGEHEQKRVETEVPNSAVLAEVLERGERIRIDGEGVALEFGVDERGTVTVCVSGEGRSTAELKKIGREVSGRVVQQFAYHTLMRELKKRNYNVLEEGVEADESIQLRVRLGR